MGRRTRGTATGAPVAGKPDLRVAGTSSEIEAQIERALALVTKKFGNGSIGTVWGNGPITPIDFVPTGSFSLDLALGVGGLPRGRIVEIYGQEGGGKTTLALQAIARAQAQGFLCGFVDAEHALDPNYASRLGVNCHTLLLSQPSCGEEGLEIVDTLLDVRPAVIVVDSVAALVPKAELEGEMGDVHVGLQARMMGQALRKLDGRAHRANTLVIFINQLRYKIGMSMGSPETTTGGNSLKFYASVRLDVRRIGSIKRGEEVLGNKVKIKVVKNKLAPPYRTCETDLIFGQGFDNSGEILDYGVALGIIKKAGSWFTYEGKQLGQGRAFVAELLTTAAYRELQQKIMDAVTEKYKMASPAADAGEEAEEEEDAPEVIDAD